MFGKSVRGRIRTAIRPPRPGVDGSAVIWPLLLMGLLNVGCGGHGQQPPSKGARKQARSEVAHATAHTSPSHRTTTPDTDAAATDVASTSATPAWANWRGPGGRAVAADCNLPKTWPLEPPRPTWQVTLGTGWSSPIVVEGRVFVTDRSATVERVLAFDAQSGEPIWERTSPVDFDPHAVGRAHGNGPKATPAWAAGRVYSLGIAGWLQCSKAADGTPIWSHNLPAEFGRREPLPSGRATVVGEQHVLVPVAPGEGAPVPLFGYTGSPLVVDDKVILSVGGELGGTIMAFDATTGAAIWQALHENVSYSSPVVAELGGVRQVVVMTGPRVVGLRLSDGVLLWSYPFQIQYDESIGTPAIGDDLVLVTGTYRPLTALHITADGDGQSATLAWENPDLESYLSSMVVHEGHVYGMDDGGRFACVRLSDGVTQWSAGRNGFYCSPVLCGAQFIGLNEKGELSAFEASPRDFVLRARLRLTEVATWTMPAVVGGRLYVRSGDGLACFDFSQQ
ncbi:MAG: PQQ-like beta-propeller repeat protein [Pirellulales bacterium]|nr:PQQ-like beta-propeller repeat protein [Pirellulales bacterium]